MFSIYTVSLSLFNVTLCMGYESKLFSIHNRQNNKQIFNNHRSCLLMIKCISKKYGKHWKSIKSTVLSLTIIVTNFIKFHSLQQEFKNFGKKNARTEYTKSRNWKSNPGESSWNPEQYCPELKHRQCRWR